MLSQVTESGDRVRQQSQAKESGDRVRRPSQTLISFFLTEGVNYYALVPYAAKSLPIRGPPPRRDPFRKGASPASRGRRQRKGLSRFNDLAMIHHLIIYIKVKYKYMLNISSLV